MKVGNIGSMSVDINVNKRLLIVTIGEKRFEFEAETETDAYDMLEEYSAFLEVFLKLLAEALLDFAKKKNGGKNE